MTSIGERMPKLHCKCGDTINLSLIPCPSEKLLIGSADYETILEFLENQAYNEAEKMLETNALSVIICDNCGRYYVSKGKDSDEYRALVPENT
jgi:hypothetical protein